VTGKKNNRLSSRHILPFPPLSTVPIAERFPEHYIQLCRLKNNPVGQSKIVMVHKPLSFSAMLWDL